MSPKKYPFIIRNIAATLLMLPFFTSPCLAAADFQVTTDFSNPVGGGMGGGGCPSNIIGKTITSKNGTEFTDQIFIDDHCVEEKLEISINNRAYILYAVGTQRDISGFYKKYANIEEEISIRIKNVKPIKKFYDAETQCSDVFRKVKVHIEYKGMKKTVYGITSHGCP